MMAAHLPYGCVRKGGIVNVSQRNIELLIGRLLTDEAFRLEFVRHLTKTLAAFIDAGHELTAHEIQALITSSPALWNDIAGELDPRLRKVDA